MRVIDLPNPAFMARFKPKAARRETSRQHVRYTPRASHPVRIAAESAKRFTVLDIASKTGRDQNNVLVNLTAMRHAGLARIVTPSGYPVAVYERLDGGSLEGRAKTKGMAWIEAQPAGATFGFADVPGSRFQRADAVERTRKVGMIRRISARRTYSVWEVVNHET